MSKRAKKLLESMLEWSRVYHTKFWKSTPEFMNEFIEHFDPLIYEDVCHRFKIDSHLTTLKKNKANSLPGSFKSKQDILQTMLLCHFDNIEWLRNNGLLDNDRRVRVLSSPHVHEIYEWLINNFLITDFSEDDLNKIAMLGDERFSLNIIKREAERIKDIDKRNIAYLYAIVRDISLRDEYVRQKTAETQSIQELKLRSLIDSTQQAGQKIVHQFDPNLAKQWVKDREFIDLLQDYRFNHE